MTDWTVERLDALPEGVVVEMTWRNSCVTAYFRTHDEALPWAEIGREVLDRVSSRSLAAATVDAGSLRVVSVPIDALLGPAAMLVAIVARDVAVEQGADNPTHDAIRAAVAHVTGEA